MAGYFKYYRELSDNPILQRSLLHKEVFIFFLENANWQKTAFAENKEIFIDIGQLCMTLDNIVKQIYSRCSGVVVGKIKLVFTKTNLNTIIKHFVDAGMVVKITKQLKTNKKITIYSLVNYLKYQDHLNEKQTEPKQELNEKQTAEQLVIDDILEPLNNIQTEPKQELNKNLVYNKKEEKRKKNNIIYDEILNFWNSKKIIVHKMNDNIMKAIKKALNKHSKDIIIESINNYSLALQNKSGWTHKWNLETFLTVKKMVQIDNFKKGGMHYINYVEKYNNSNVSNDKLVELVKNSKNWYMPFEDWNDKRNFPNIYHKITDIPEFENVEKDEVEKIYNELRK